MGEKEPREGRTSGQSEILRGRLRQRVRAGPCRFCRSLSKGILNSQAPWFSRQAEWGGSLDKSCS